MVRKKADRKGVGNAKCDVCGMKYNGSKHWKYSRQTGLLCPKCSNSIGLKLAPGFHFKQHQGRLSDGNGCVVRNMPIEANLFGDQETERLYE